MNKLLGQHFLRCRWVLQTLIKAAEVGKSDTILEVGPGRGELTFDLARHAGRVIAVEKDRVLAQDLRLNLEDAGVANVEVVNEDILSFLKSYAVEPRKRRGMKVVGNIPYYLTSRLIRVLLEGKPKPETIVFTIQKEVAQKIVAKPPKMNLLALSVQIFGKPEIIKTVPSSCFSPRPKVDSAIIKISDISDQFFEKNRLDKTAFFEILRRAFSQKRKLLTSSLRESLDRHSINLGKARPQELSPEQWVEVCLSITKIRG